MSASERDRRNASGEETMTDRAALAVSIPAHRPGQGTELQRPPNHGGWRFLSPEEFLNQEHPELQWLVEDMLPAGGLSILSARPKVGKSTLARCLAVAVAQGRPWLNRDTAQGPVIYLALEEIERMVQAHFRMLRLQESDSVHVHIGPPPAEGLKWLAKTVTEFKPTLVIVDPLMHLISGVKDLNDYASVTGALRPFLNMARESGAHVLLVHHNSKIANDQGREILGSTALLGIVDCAISLDQDERCRSMYTRQRYGNDCEATELCLSASGWVAMGRSVRALYSMELEEEILQFLEGQTEPADADTIRESVGRKAATVKRKLRDLVEVERLLRTGSGRKSDPYLFSVPVPM